MSQKYTGGFITKSPVAPTTTAASGIWTLDQQQQAQKAGTWPSPPIFIEDIFSTYLYTGNGTSQTITNGIDLSGQGGLTWIKKRSAAEDHVLTDTVRGAGNTLFSNLTDANEYDITRLSAFTSSGFSVGGSSRVNQNANTFVSWTFREQPKFFDVVTWTGNGTTQAISHNLGAVPGFIIIKRTSSAEDWWCFHRYDFTQRFKLNAINAAVDTNNQSYLGNNTVAVAPTSTTFTVGSIGGINSSGGTFVAYLFAHDAGGFPVSGGGSTNGISCGSYVGNGMTAGPQVTLGYEPQWVLRKNITAARGGPSTAGSWSLVDNMRGMSQTTCPFLFANSSAAEDTSTVTTGYIIPNATGFVDTYTYPDDTYIYIAIRRGPMKVPTSGTSVFTPVLGRSANPNYLAGFPVDLGISEYRVNGSNSTGSRLQGSNSMDTASTGAEASDGSLKWDFMDGYYTGGRTTDFVSWAFRRAPSFFDEVCYTGTGSATTFNHNLGVVPELMIVKERNGANGWQVYSASLTNTEYLILNTSAGVPASSATRWNSTTPTSTVFSVGTHGATNGSGQNFVNYLFATCAGVSKVGSYTGNGSTQTIDCGFGAGGARFVLIKRTDSTSDWYVYDTARGMTTLTDPYLTLNSTTAEAATLGSVTTVSTGFALNSTILAAINVSAGTYIFLAIA